MTLDPDLDREYRELEDEFRGLALKACKGQGPMWTDRMEQIAMREAGISIEQGAREWKRDMVAIGVFVLSAVVIAVVFGLVFGR